MPTTFLNLTNELLRAFNEVEIPAADFPTVRGVHAVAKDAIRKGIKDIENYVWEFPFNHSPGSQLLVVGQNEYDFPSDYKIADWDSFYVEKDTSLSVNTTPMRFMQRDHWQERQKSVDLDAGSDGVSTPYFIFKTNENGFGVTPSPDKAYTVNYEYFTLTPTLDLYTDTSNIPTQWDNVIIAAATPYMYLFRANNDSTQQSKQEAMSLMRQMRGILVNDYDTVYSGMINFGQKSTIGRFLDD